MKNPTVNTLAAQLSALPVGALEVLRRALPYHPGHLTAAQQASVRIARLKLAEAVHYATTPTDRPMASTRPKLPKYRPYVPETHTLHMPQEISQ